VSFEINEKKNVKRRAETSKEIQHQQRERKKKILRGEGGGKGACLGRVIEGPQVGDL